MKIDVERIIKIAAGAAVLIYGADCVIKGSSLIIEGLKNNSETDADLEISHAGA